MACVARHRQMRSRQREVGDTVVKLSGRPTRCCMTFIARSREAGCSMVGIRSLRVFSFVTGEARRRRPCVTCSVATIACYFHMRARKRESGQVVIQGRGYPSVFRVTLCALRGKSIGHVIRIRGGGEVVFMACQARRRSACKSCFMTIVAGDRRVRAREWEVREIMIELCGLPRRRRVASLAIVGEV